MSEMVNDDIFVLLEMNQSVDIPQLDHAER